MGFLDSAVNAGASIATGAMGAGASLLGQAGSIVYNSIQARKQREWNEAMMAKQNAWNEEMWAKTNEYNSPTAQMERMRDAGLNPLFYGLDGNSADAMESAQPLGYERASIDNIANPVAAGLTAAAQVAQISNIQADTAKKNNENLTETQRREQMQAEIEKTKQELENLRKQADLTEAERMEIDKRLEWADRLNEAILGEKEANKKLNESQKKEIDTLLKGKGLLQAKTLEDFEHKWAKMDAEIEKMAEETNLLKEDIENYALNHMSNGFMGTGGSVQNFLRWIKPKKEQNTPHSGSR